MGDEEGSSVGLEEGVLEGKIVGKEEGKVEGINVGGEEDSPVGLEEGVVVGILVGREEDDGIVDGATVGDNFVPLTACVSKSEHIFVSNSYHLNKFNNKETTLS